MNTIHVLGVDPGNISGWALVRIGKGKPELLYWGQSGGVRVRKGERIVTKSSGTSASEVISRCQTRIEEQDEFKPPRTAPPIVLAIEDQFIPSQGGKDQDDRAKAVSILTTARHCGGWEYAAQMHGLDVAPRVLPHVWRRSQWGAARWTTTQAKKQALTLCKALWGVSIPKMQHHTAEAAFIACHVGETIRHERRTR